MQKNKKIFLILFFSIIVIAIATIGISFAIKVIENSTVSNITVGSVSVKTHEVWEKDPIIYPTSEVQKIVTFENTGTISTLLRVKIDKAWGESRDENGNLIVNKSLSVDNINININTDKWKDGGDGYYYYLGILEPGATTEPIFESFTIDAETGNEYQGMLADILVSVEVVQAESTASEEIWHKNYEFFEVKAPEIPADKGETKVTFISPLDEFDIKYAPHDLFLNFKNLSAGITRSQVLEICNNYNKDLEMFLKAEYADPMGEGDPTLIEKLIKQLVSITITSNDKKVYEGPIYGNIEAEKSSMKNYLSLGTFSANDCSKIAVSLTTSNELTKEYENLLGNIKWTFMTAIPNPQVITHHVLDLDPTIKLDEDEKIDYENGDNYTTTPSKKVLDDNYELVRDSGNTSGIIGDDDIEVTYYYRLKPKFDPPIIDKNGTNRIQNTTDWVDNKIVYSVHIEAYTGTATVTLVDKLPAPLQDDYILDGGIYDPTDLTITWNIDVLLNTITDGPKDLVITKNIKIKYTDYSAGTLVNVVTGTLLFDNGTPIPPVTDDHPVVHDNKGNIIVHHYLYGSDDNGNPPIKLADDVEINGPVGETYISNQADLDEYELVEIPYNYTGTIPEGTTEVIYYYKPKNPTPGNTIDKIGQETMNSLSDIYPYTITYNATLDNYTGPATLKIVDKLEYPINPEESELDGGTYDEATLTITWEVPFDVTESLDETIRKDIKLKYHFVSDKVTQVVNIAKGQLIYGDETIETTDTVTTKVKTPIKIIVHHYYNDTTTKLDKDIIISTYPGKEYETSISQKVQDDGYTFVKVVGTSKGTAGENDIEIIYYYIKADNPYTADSIVKYIITMSIATIILGISVVSLIKANKKDIYNK